jgi:hypothetical protein
MSLGAPQSTCSGEAPVVVRDTLLRASTISYLFRALATAEAQEQQRIVELHITRLINELTETDGGFIIPGVPGGPLESAARERDFPRLAQAPHSKVPVNSVNCATRTSC